MNKIALAVVACFSLAAGAASAQQSGAYAGIAGGGAYSNAASKAETSMGYASTTKKENTEAGFKVYGGYSWGTWGLEAGYYNFGNYTIAGLIGASNAQSNAATSALALSATGAILLAKNWALMGKLGVGYAASKFHCDVLCTGFPDDNAHSLAPLYGVGVKWNVQEKISVRMDWEGMSSVLARAGGIERKLTVGLVSVGIESRF